VKLAKHNRVQLIRVPGHKGTEGNETANQLERLDPNVHSQDLNQLAAFQQGLPSRLSGTGQTETIKYTGSP
jgi:hypothetical protein